jgi:hypothetical protein
MKTIALLTFTLFSSHNLMANIIFDSSYLMKLKESKVDFKIRSDQNSKKIASLLEKETAFQGLYLRVEGQKSVNSSFYSRKVALELELLENGWRESKLYLDKKKQESLLENLQLQNNVNEKKQASDLHAVNMVRNTIRFKSLQAKIGYLYALKETKQAQLVEGIISQDEFSITDLKLKKAILNLKYLKNATNQKIEKLWFTVLNRIENVELIAKNKLYSAINKVSIQQKIQDIMILRNQYHPSYLDNMRLSVYFENKQVSTLTQNIDDDGSFIDSGKVNENLIGIKARIPIDFNFNRSEIVHQKSTSYEFQKKVIQHREAQRLDALVNLFHFKQTGLRTLFEEYKLLEIQRKHAIKRLQVKGLKYQPENTLNQLAINKSDLKEAILIARLDTLEVLLQLNHLVNFKTIDLLLNKI